LKQTQNIKKEIISKKYGTKMKGKIAAISKY
jgi:hypothetical protein